MIKLLWVVTALLCVLAGVVLIGSVLLASGAPQQAAGAASAAALAVIPYVFTRAMEGLFN